MLKSKHIKISNIKKDYSPDPNMRIEENIYVIYYNN